MATEGKSDPRGTGNIEITDKYAATSLLPCRLIRTIDPAPKSNGSSTPPTGSTESKFRVNAFDKSHHPMLRLA